MPSELLMRSLTGRLTTISKQAQGLVYLIIEYSLRCFLRKYESCVSLEEEDLTMLIRKYDRDVDGGWGFSEFITANTPLLQYSLKPKNIQKV